MPEVTSGFRQFNARLTTAHRFVLQRDAVQMILGITDSSPKRLLAALNICKLPYRRMWVEFAFRDRVDWINDSPARQATVVVDRDAPPPQRMGFYLESLDDAGRNILIQCAWVHDDIAASFGHLALIINTDPDHASQITDEARAGWRDNPENGWTSQWRDQPDEIDAAVEFESRLEITIPPWSAGIWATIDAELPEDAQKRLHEMAIFDLRSEWRFVVGLLTTLNSRNVIETSEPVDLSKLNRSRQKSGKPALMPYREIKLRLSRVQRNRGQFGTSGRPMRSHDVRGHWKLRATGLFWWADFERGHGGPSAVRTYSVVA